MGARTLLSELLELELKANAIKFGFIERGLDCFVSDDLLERCISALNELSISNSEEEKREVIAICALLWTYRKMEWDGLKDYLILFLSRAGFGPSSTMVDSAYSQEDRAYSDSQSLVNQFAISLAQVEFEVSIDERRFLLSNFQRDLWRSIDENTLLGISAPTSAGKSFLIVLKTIELLKRKPGTVVFVVPTLSLVTQVVTDFRKALDDFNLEEFSIETTYNELTATRDTIYVLTQEKAIAAFSQKGEPFGSIRLLIIEEIQNVEKVADFDDQRSRILYDLMIELRNTSKIDHVIISGPRILNIDELGRTVFGLISSKRETNASPVLNLAYSINKKKSKYYLNVFSDLLEQNYAMEITNDKAIAGYGKVLYVDEYLDYLKEFMSKINKNESSLIFSPNSRTCGRIANYLTRDSENMDSKYLNGLADFISETVHPNFDLVGTLRKGVAYHHGKLPFHVRLLVEDGVKKREIRTVICTTTLLQGVNLPVQNIIIRNPNLFVKKMENSSKLSNYELANLRGRAGRLLKDFVGRTYILDESGFKDEESGQFELFKEASKELQVGYGEAYQHSKVRIIKDIDNGIGSTDGNREYSFLSTYIRQTALRYGLNSQIFLSRVGIDVTDGELNLVLDSLSKLDIDKAICNQNRYWDPVDLNRLFLNRNKFDLPRSPHDQNTAYRLKSILIFLSQNFPTYYSRYFRVPQAAAADLLLQKCILAENWLKERRLRELLSNKFYDSSDKIDEAIRDLQNTISYGLPLLLKPIYDIVTPNSMFPRFIEMGAYKPVTRRLIELSVPRETAIYLGEKYAFEDIDNKGRLLSRLRNIRQDLPYWHKVQLVTI